MLTHLYIVVRDIGFLHCVHMDGNVCIVYWLIKRSMDVR